MDFYKTRFDRSAFAEALDAKLRGRKIVYISAQAGWGKTIAVQDWLCNHSRAVMIAASQLPTWSGTPKGTTLLVVDDLQDATDEAMQTYLLPLLQQTAKVRFVLLGRAELPSVLCPFALTGQLAVVDHTALALSRDVIDTYLADTELCYSVETSEFLMKESKGYPVAVDCLVEQMKNGLPCTEQTVQKATQALFQYYEQVVFFRFSAAAQSFLLKIAPFSEFTLRMAVMVSGDSDIQRVLNEITHRGQSVVVTPSEQYTVPYFFHRFLMYRQQRYCAAETVEQSWRSAEQYYEICDEIPQALRCCQQVNDWDKMVELLIRHTRRPPYTTFYFELKQYYLALPTELVQQHPELMCSLSMIYSMNMQPRESEAWYEKLQNYALAQNKNSPERKMAMERLAFLRIGLPHRGSKKIAQTLLDLVRLYQGGDGCIQCISPTSGMPSLMHGAKDFCRWSKRDETLYRIMKKPIELVLGKAGIGVADAGLAESLLERCTLQNMADVMTYAVSAMNQTEQMGTLDVHVAAVANIVRLSIMRGDLALAQRNLEHVEAMAKADGNARLLFNIQAFRTRVALLGGKTAEVSQWMLESAPDEVTEFQLLNRYQYMVKARCYLLKGREMDAIALLMRMTPYFEMGEHHYCLMETRMLLAIAQYRIRQDGWETPLQQALEAMEHYGFLRLPAEEGAALLPLLKDWNPEGQSAYVQAMIREVARYANLYPDYLQPPNLPTHPLTQTEKQVLRLLNQGLKNDEIAQNLHVSTRTVKFHTGNIFAKLGVKSRTEAIALSRKWFE